MRRNIAVIGAGITGLCTALLLRRDGHEVSLFDPSPAKASASFGNAGSLSPATIVPMAMPGTMQQVPRWLCARDGPLTVRLQRLPALAGWASHFARSCYSEEAERAAAALAPLLADAPARYRTLLGRTAASGLIRSEGSLTIYRGEADWRAAQTGLELRRRNGIAVQEVAGEELPDLDGALRRDLFRGVLFPENGQCVDNGALMLELMNQFMAEGGVFGSIRVSELVFSGEALTGLRTSDSLTTIPVDTAVIAAGTGSASLARQAGHRVRVTPEFGYHVMLAEAACRPRLPTMDGSRKFVVSSMRQGVRISGFAEFAAADSSPRWRHAQTLLEQGRDLFPGLAEAGDEVTMWRGPRPSTPDSLPVIGASRRCAEVICAFGHGHVGLTAAPMTARIVADLVSRRPQTLDIAPFSPARFQLGAGARRRGPAI